MANYSRLLTVIKSALAQSSDNDFADAVSECLLNIWYDDYGSIYSVEEVVVVPLSGLFYLFDIEPGRLIAAWGVSQGQFGGNRSSIKGRMAGHPRMGGTDYHRGHAIAHILHGGTDINIVPQLGSINLGPFKVLERDAANTPGAVYFSYWSCSSATDQVPSKVDQGLLVRGQRNLLNIKHHKN